MEEMTALTLWLPDGNRVPPRPTPLAARIPWSALGAIVPFVIGAAYVLAYLWEFAYASHFRIPRALIAVEHETVLARAVPVVLGAIGAAWLLGATSLWAARHPERRRRLAVLGVVVLGLFFTPLALAAHQSWLTWLLTMSVVPAQWALKVLYRKARRRPRPPTDNGTLADWTIKYVGSSIVTVIVLFAYLAGIFFMWGLNDAQGKRRFQVIDDADLVVLAIYGRLAIAAPVPTTPGELDGSLHLVRLDREPIALEPQRIGPLRPRS